MKFSSADERGFRGSQRLPPAARLRLRWTDEGVRPHTIQMMKAAVPTTFSLTQGLWGLRTRRSNDREPRDELRGRARSLGRFLRRLDSVT